MGGLKRAHKSARATGARRTAEESTGSGQPIESRGITVTSVPTPLASSTAFAPLSCMLLLFGILQRTSTSRRPQRADQPNAAAVHCAAKPAQRGQGEADRAARRRGRVQSTPSLGSATRLSPFLHSSRAPLPSPPSRCSFVCRSVLFVPLSCPAVWSILPPRESAAAESTPRSLIQRATCREESYKECAWA